MYDITITSIKNDSSGGTRDKIITVEFAGRTYTIQCATNKSKNKLEKDPVFKSNITQLIRLNSEIQSFKNLDNFKNLDTDNLSLEVNENGNVNAKHNQSNVTIDLKKLMTSENLKIPVNKKSLSAAKKIIFTPHTVSTSKKIEEKSEDKHSREIKEKSTHESLSESSSQIKEKQKKPVDVEKKPVETERLSTEYIFEIGELIDQFNDKGMDISERQQLGLAIVSMLEKAYSSIAESKADLRKEIASTNDPATKKLLLEEKAMVNDVVKKIQTFLSESRKYYPA